MTGVPSLVVGGALSLAFQYLSRGEPRLSHAPSTALFLCALLLLLYRFHCQPWRARCLPLRLSCDVIAIFIVIEIAYSFLWKKVEYLFLEKVPDVLNDALRAVKPGWRLEAWMFAPLLYFIAGGLLYFSYNNDVCLDSYTQEEEDDTDDGRRESVSLVELWSARGAPYGDTRGLMRAGLMAPPPTRPVTLRGATTCTTAHRHR